MKLHTSALVLAMAGIMLSQTAFSNDSPNLSNSEFQQCLSTLKNSSTFRSVSGATFEKYRPSQPDPSVIRSLNYQPEFKKDVWDYLASLVDSERVQDGIRAKHEQADVLRRIESYYGVKPEHVLGVWGVESNFGQTLGKKNLFDSLATLSCFDRRQSYFRGEYANALKIVQNGDIHPEDMTGSWAGAFGQTQFMPSTFLELAVDFDGDGRKDLVNSKADALASTANFLVKRGYRLGEPWGYEVRLNGYNGSSGRRNKQSINHWRAQGITLPNGQPIPNNMASAGLLLPAGRQGPAFLVGKNFDTFYSYNASESYALAIAQLSDLVRDENTNTNFATPWPTDDPGIGRRESKEIQQALINTGYDIGAVDGIIGDNTRQAIMDYQRKVGVTPDGRAGQKFHRLITGRTASIQPAQTPAQAMNTPAPLYHSVQPTVSTQATAARTVIVKPANTTPTTGTTYRRVINADGSSSWILVE